MKKIVKKLLLTVFVFIFMGCLDPCSAAWEDEKPDACADSASVGWGYTKDNFMCLKPSIKSFTGGWNNSVCDDLYITGPFWRQAAEPTVDADGDAVSDGMIWIDSDDNHVFVYDSTWIDIGGKIRALSIDPSCGAENEGEIYYNTASTKILKCDGAGSWADIAVGVTATKLRVAGEASWFTGEIEFRGSGAGVTQGTYGGVDTITITGSTAGTMFHNVAATTLGNDNPPTVEWLGDTDYEGASVALFSTGVTQTEMFTWATPSNIDTSESIFIYADVIIDNVDPSGSSVAFNMRSYSKNTANSDTDSASGITTYSEYTSGNPLTVAERQTFEIGTGNFGQNDILTIAFTRGYNSGTDYSGDFGVINYMIAYTRE